MIRLFVYAVLAGFLSGIVEISRALLAEMRWRDGWA